MQLSPGLRISPSLSLVRKLGQGGMGSVWVAEHLTLHTQVAVKFISADAAAHPGILERFNREASIAAQMKHPHAVQVFDHGISHQGMPFLAMELLEGEDVRHRIDRLRRLNPAETSIILGQSGRALARAHSIGLVHRDIKPDNIFLIQVDGELFVKVLDFGIAKVLDLGVAGQLQSTGQGATATGAMLGTPYYMSPEQTMNAKDVDARADLWSLAVVAYHCVTGTVPFDGDSLPTVLLAIVNGTFEPPSRRVPGLPPAVDAWFAKALARDAGSRFSSAKELADAFARAVGSPVVSENPPPPPQHVALPQALDPERAPLPPTLDGAAITHGHAPSNSRTHLAVALALLVCLVGIAAIALMRLGNSQVTSPQPNAHSPGDFATASLPLASQLPSASPLTSSTLPAVAASTLSRGSGSTAGARKPPKDTGARTDIKNEPGKDKAPSPANSTKPPGPPPDSKMPELGL
jgi:eukaryotic-like serine/threonine-protein kinase